VVPGSRHVRYAVNGPARIAFEDLGGVGGDPLLLIMGLAVSRFWWSDALVAEFVRRGFHVVAYDQRDAGQSTHFADAGTASPLAAVLRRHSPAYSAEDMADDAVAVLDALGWDSAHLFGHSMGGQVAQRTALRHPGRVRSLTSSASLPGDVGGLVAGRYVHLGLVARLARLKVPEGRDGDIALAVAATRALAARPIPSTSRRYGRWQHGTRSAVCVTPPRKAARPAPNGMAAGCPSSACQLSCCTAPTTRCYARPPPGTPPRRSAEPGWSSCPGSATTCLPRCTRR
jgi:pimeloyl-ACP methyl ester carboxylesterase